LAQVLTSTSVRVVVVSKLAVRNLVQHKVRQDAERLKLGSAWRDDNLASMFRDLELSG